MELLKFGAPWCGSCKKLGKMIEQEQLRSAVNVREINVEDEPDLADKYSIMNLPIMVLVGDDGVSLARWSGVHPGIIDEVKNAVNKFKV